MKIEANRLQEGLRMLARIVHTAAPLDVRIRKGYIQLWATDKLFVDCQGTSETDHEFIIRNQGRFRHAVQEMKGIITMRVEEHRKNICRLVLSTPDMTFVTLVSCNENKFFAPNEHELGDLFVTVTAKDMQRNLARVRPAVLKGTGNRLNYLYIARDMQMYASDGHVALTTAHAIDDDVYALPGISAGHLSSIIQRRGIVFLYENACVYRGPENATLVILHGAGVGPFPLKQMLRVWDKDMPNAVDSAINVRWLIQELRVATRVIRNPSVVLFARKLEDGGAQVTLVFRPVDEPSMLEDGDLRIVRTYVDTRLDADFTLYFQARLMLTALATGDESTRIQLKKSGIPIAFHSDDTMALIMPFHNPTEDLGDLWRWVESNHENQG